MTKYLVFKNQPDSGKVNAPGSREEMACAIVKVVCQDTLSKDFYIAYPQDHPHSTWESLKDLAKYSVVIDDERAELWEQEIVPLTAYSVAIDDAIGQAYSAIAQAARTFDHACEKSKNFQNVRVLDNLGMDPSFDNLENLTFVEISDKVDEIYEVESFRDQHHQQHA
jgi:hypothetical protein